MAWPTDPEEWCAATGTTVVSGIAYLHKRVRPDWQSYAEGPSGRATYTIGATTTAPDWLDDDLIGHGLHAFATFGPRIATRTPRDWRPSKPWPPRPIVVTAPVTDLRPIAVNWAPMVKAESFYVDRQLANDGSELP